MLFRLVSNWRSIFGIVFFLSFHLIASFLTNAFPVLLIRMFLLTMLLPLLFLPLLSVVRAQFANHPPAPEPAYVPTSNYQWGLDPWRREHWADASPHNQLYVDSNGRQGMRNVPMQTHSGWFFWCTTKNCAGRRKRK